MELKQLHTLLAQLSREKVQLLFVLVLGISIRLFAIPTFMGPPYGPVDVYYVDEQAARAILHLSNPYLQNYTTNGLQSGIFVYLPFIPVYYAPFYALGDIRYGNIFADVLVMVSVYFIARSIGRGRVIYAPLLYAILPPSIWLTSVSSTNIMIGTALLMLSVAAILNEKFLFGSLFLGLAVATSQLVVLALPPIVYYFLKRSKTYQLSAALLVAAAIVLPFLLMFPSEFVYDVLEFQFVRQLQANGSFSLYSILYVLLGFRLTSWIRATIFLILVSLTMVWFSRRIKRLVMSVGLLLLLGAFVLPVNGFWNYFLPALTIGCVFLPSFIDQIGQTQKTDKPVESLA